MSKRTALGLVSAMAIAGLTSSRAALGQTYDVVPPLPAGVIPVPSSALPQAPVSGQQYVVFVSGTSDTLLRQVQMVEPTAFRTTFQGQPVIQAGRFSYATNAQQRVADLAARGVAAQMAQAPIAQPYYAQTPVLPANVYASSGELPPLPAGVGVMPPSTTTGLPGLPTPSQLPPTSGNVEFGQQLTYAAPANSAPSTVNVLPPSGTAVAAPSVAPVNAPYYVVIPTSGSNLAALSSQVIQLGTPADRVQQRTEPRGPHVAVGPFADRGLAERWNAFYRDAGISNSRVFFQR